MHKRGNRTPDNNPSFSEWVEIARHYPFYFFRLRMYLQQCFILCSGRHDMFYLPIFLFAAYQNLLRNQEELNMSVHVLQEYLLQRLK